MTSIQLYSNQEFSVRSVTDTDGTVWFVAKDIAEALEYSEASNPSRLFANVPRLLEGCETDSHRRTWRAGHDLLNRTRRLLLLGAK